MTESCKLRNVRNDILVISLVSVVIYVNIIFTLENLNIIDDNALDSNEIPYTINGIPVWLEAPNIQQLPLSIMRYMESQYGSTNILYGVASVLLNSTVSVLFYLMCRLTSFNQLQSRVAAVIFTCHPIHSAVVC